MEMRPWVLATVIIATSAIAPYLPGLVLPARAVSPRPDTTGGPPQEKPPPAVLNAQSDWELVQLAEGSLSRSIQDLVEAYRQEAARARDLDTRLHWVLDNWVPKKPAAPPVK